MGYMTPMMILNDAIDLIKDKKNQAKFCEDLYYAALDTGKETTIGISCFCNPVTVLRPKHADIGRIIYF